MARLKTHCLGGAVFLAALCWNGFSSTAAGADNDIAIVVRQDVPVENLTFAELRRLLLGARQFWTSNLGVTPVVGALGGGEWAESRVLERDGDVIGRGYAGRGCVCGIAAGSEGAQGSEDKRSSSGRQRVSFALNEYEAAVFQSRAGGENDFALPDRFSPWQRRDGCRL